MFLRLVVLLCVCSITCVSRNAIKMTKTAETPQRITYSGGNGDSFHEAAIINGVRNKSEGVAAEYSFISKKHGTRGTNWLLVGQTVIREKNKIVDVIEIQLENSADRRIFYFDVGDFFGKHR